MVHVKAIALTYDLAQDRILAIINPCALDSWSYWLTRRLVLQLIRQLPSALEATSPALKQAPAEHRGELAAFERDAALASTQKAMTHTPDRVVQAGASIAELAVGVSIAQQNDAFLLELKGARGGHAKGIFNRPQLQTMLTMIEHEIIKGNWRDNVAEPATAQVNTKGWRQLN